MAHATKCAAPEGNRGRDEWMTVIEERLNYEIYK